MHKSYKCLDRFTGRIYIPRDVVFDESLFFLMLLQPLRTILLLFMKLSLSFIRTCYE
jgi:hypothetical protein